MGTDLRSPVLAEMQFLPQAPKNHAVQLLRGCCLYRMLSDRERALVITGVVDRLAWEGEIDPCLIEAIHNLHVNVMSMFVIQPEVWRMKPIDDKYVQGVLIELIEIDARWMSSTAVS